MTQPATSARLAVRVRRLDATPDLVSRVEAARDSGHEAILFERPMPEAVSIAGLGRVVDVVADARGAHVEDVEGNQLATEPGADRVRATARLWQRWSAPVAEPGPDPTAPVALGGFAFRPDRDPGPPWAGFPAVQLRVPALTLFRSRGRTVAISATLAGAGDPKSAVEARLDASEALLELETPGYRGPRAHRLINTPVHTPENWMRLVVAAVEVLAGGRAEKVVLARETLARGDGVVTAGGVLRALRSSYPSCFIYLVPGADGTALVGASPELLLRRVGGTATFHPMAGSAARGHDAADDDRLAAELLASAKNRREHAVVVRGIVEALNAAGAAVEAPDIPEVVRFTNIQHLASEITAQLPVPPPPALALCGMIHPTPAVGGHPTAAALDLIDELEGMDRGWYAGAVGWTDAAGDGEFAAALRCGLLWEDGARLFAGVGIMPDSDPAAELTETDLKLRALLGALLA